jgi:hypothetical protein
MKKVHTASGKSARKLSARAQARVDAQLNRVWPFWFDRTALRQLSTPNEHYRHGQTRTAFEALLQSVRNLLLVAPSVPKAREVVETSIETLQAWANLLGAEPLDFACEAFLDWWYVRDEAADEATYREKMFLLNLTVGHTIRALWDVNAPQPGEDAEDVSDDGWPSADASVEVPDGTSVH